MTKIRWGVLATGNIAAEFTTDLKLVPDAEVAAVGSRALASAEAFASEHGIPRAHGSWAELAADPDVDIIYIATTHNAHFEAAELCLRAGKPVLVEKPLTVSLAQAERLVALARERGLFLMEAMWMRCNPGILRMLDVIAAGTIGEVRSVHADFALGESFAPEHRLRNPELAGGGLLDLGVYPVAFAQMVLGAPASVAVSGWRTPEGVDAMAGLLLGYETAVAALTCGIVSASPCVAQVTGTKGFIELSAPFFRPSAIRVTRGTTEAAYVTEELDVSYTGAGLFHEAMEAMRCLREGLTESPLVPWRSTLDVMTTLDEARRRLGVVYPGE